MNQGTLNRIARQSAPSTPLRGGGSLLIGPWRGVRARPRAERRIWQQWVLPIGALLVLGVLAGAFVLALAEIARRLNELGRAGAAELVRSQGPEVALSARSEAARP